MSEARQNLIMVQLASDEFVDEHRRGYSIAELAEYAPGLSEITVRRIVDDDLEEFIQKREDGKYYPLVKFFTPSFFDKTQEV